jgi:hypothetical protein
MLDVTVRIEKERLGTLPWSQRAQLLTEQRIKPGQAIDTRYGDNTSVRQVDEGGTAQEVALFGEGIAIRGCDSRANGFH